MYSLFRLFRIQQASTTHRMWDNTVFSDFRQEKTILSVRQKDSYILGNGIILLDNDNFLKSLIKEARITKGDTLECASI